MAESSGHPLGPRSVPGPDYGKREPFRPAWIDVPALFPAPEPARPRAVDGLDASREAPGVVHYWTRSGDGLWIACCTFTMRYLDGRERRLEYQFLPETLLRPRDVGSRTGASRVE